MSLALRPFDRLGTGAVGRPPLGLRRGGLRRVPGLKRMLDQAAAHLVSLADDSLPDDLAATGNGLRCRRGPSGGRS